MQNLALQPIAVTEPEFADRMGLARLTQQAFVGVDLRPLGRGLSRHES